MAYRINPKGGIVPVRPGPTSSFSYKYLSFLLKAPIRLVKLSDGRKMAVRAESFERNTKEPYNEKATKLLHETWQKTAIVYGPVIVINPEDLK